MAGFSEPLSFVGTKKIKGIVTSYPRASHFPRLFVDTIFGLHFSQM